MEKRAELNLNKANPNTIHDEVRKLVPGSKLTLESGQYCNPVVISDLSGTQEYPIIIRSDKNAIFGSKLSFEEYRETGNKHAEELQRTGRIPGLYHVADEAYVILRNCQYVFIENIKFCRCWPTAIYIDNCQRIELRKLTFKEGTIAIGATGINTRHLTIEYCSWQQDVSDKNNLWKTINWRRVHGGYVDVEKDFRAFDGDFFRAWNIAGFVTIRKNLIEDAFNAIHFFNEDPEGYNTKISRNVIIEDNKFIRIRDNAIEPEYFAWNWIVRHNQFIDCYSPFSLEMTESGYFYIYGNLGWNISRPGPKNDTHALGRIFKLDHKKHKASGPHYIIHNSWFVRAPIVSKYAFEHFIHINNAIDYNKSIWDYDEIRSAPFGREWWLEESLPNPQISEKKRFTKRWSELNIQFDGDIIHHPYFPRDLRTAGYPIGSDSKGYNPGFKNAGQHAEGLKLERSSKGRGRALGFEIKYADEETTEEVERGGDVGAWQGDKLFKLNKI